MILGWFRRGAVIKRLEEELADERATLVVVECAVKPECRETIRALRAENEHLKTIIDGS